MEETYRLEAIILQRQPFRESDTRVVVMSRERGKLELVARGTRKIRSKLAGHLEPISLVEMMAVRGRRYDYVGSAISREAFVAIKEDLDKLTVVGQVISILMRLVKFGERDEKLFALLTDYLTFFNQTGKANHRFITGAFYLRLLGLLGYQPDAYACADCGEKIMPGNENFFDARLGGIICGKCRSRKGMNERIMPVSDDVIKIVRYSQQADWQDLPKLKISDKLTVEFSGLVNAFLREQI